MRLQLEMSTTPSTRVSTCERKEQTTYSKLVDLSVTLQAFVVSSQRRSSAQWIRQHASVLNPKFKLKS